MLFFEINFIFYCNLERYVEILVDVIYEIIGDMVMK